MNTRPHGLGLGEQERAGAVTEEPVEPVQVDLRLRAWTQHQIDPFPSGELTYRGCGE